ncbi:phosphate acetyltransferase [Roseobacter ponti]|uniref:Phosphate acetyltransferase n=1 Tax=Roseobacter ponti TaxID=1891787 RepID=A0A858SUZ5_9RHOB|nr:phosphate acetyltransferase [Roseobacter ponti]QJF52779.1 phosphate acetyltransferase [Roseobacter ponti]
MSVLRDLSTRASARPAHIVMSEGHDPRVVAGAVAAVKTGTARITLVGPQDRVAAALVAAGEINNPALQIEDPETSALSASLASAFYELRKHKGVTPEIAESEVRKPLVFSALMVREGHADGTVGGAVATTSDTVRAALQIIGKAKEAPLVSSFFLMALPENHPSGRDGMIFGDCGLVIDPTSEELAAIAVASAASCRALLETEPVVALLSFSTHGSARHSSVSKVAAAAALLKENHPGLRADGELQFDAAFVPQVAASKAKGSSVAGEANVMIFPNLDAGNIGYKIAQRIGGADAIGPVLQGLSKPANDLSRGCTAADVTNMIAVTVLQVAR